ncbi:MAG TPA: iron-containing redox enzyme family protein [Acidimicrobiales bacterium]|nr:iron-containing redox enzyme family protein [Acidimicrobiales bacterium]
MKSEEFNRRINELAMETSQQLRWWSEVEENITKPMAIEFVKQFGLFPRHSRQCWANVVGNCPILEVRRFVVTENLWEEEANEETSHYQLLVDMGVALGMTEDEITNAEPIPSTQTAFLAWETLTRTQPWIEGLAAKGSLEALNQAETGNLSGLSAKRWMANLGLSSDDVAFWGVHSELDQDHAHDTLEIIGKYATEQDLDRAYVSSRKSHGVWLVLMNGIADHVLSLAD